MLTIDNDTQRARAQRTKEMPLRTIFRPSCRHSLVVATLGKLAEGSFQSSQEETTTGTTDSPPLSIKNIYGYNHCKSAKLSQHRDIKLSFSPLSFCISVSYNPKYEILSNIFFCLLSFVFCHPPMCVPLAGVQFSSQQLPLCGKP